MTELFFQLIQVALGLRKDFPSTLTADEWRGLYDTAKKQAMLGICFAGVQEICDSDMEEYCGMSEDLYYKWMGMVARICEKNELLYGNCHKIHSRLSNDGMQSCLLKGQGLAGYYGKLAHFRQPGDIDLWIMPDDAVRNGVVADSLTDRHRLICDYCRSSLPGYDTKKEGKQHTSYKFAKDTEVELHFTPGFLSAPRRNRELQSWFNGQWPQCAANRKDGLCVPTVQFNLVYMLLHTFRHTLFEGIGLRQIMDYYFVTLSSTKAERDEAFFNIKSLGMAKFAGGLVWVMREVLCLDSKYFICEPDERHGRLLLDVILEGGNFGHFSHYKLSRGATVWNHIKRYLSRNWMLLWYYPSEVLWYFMKKICRIGG